MRLNTKGLKKDISKPLEDKLRRKMRNLPDIAVRFLHSTNKKIRTQIEYAKDLTLFFDFLIESRKCNKNESSLITEEDLKNLTVYDIEDFLSHLVEYERTYVSPSGRVIVHKFENSPIGISRKRATLSKFFDHLVKRDYLDVNIMEKLEKVDIDDDRGIKDRLQERELQRLFEVILEDEKVESDHSLKYHQKLKKRDYIIVLLLAYTGIRVGELVQLDVDDVYVQRGYFDVIRKGGNKERIYMPDRIIEDIAEYVEARKAIKDVKSKALFLSLQKKRISDKAIREMLLKYEKRSGIEVRLTPHLFRRTFGTNHYNTYKDMYLTAKVLGHETGETTRKYYADPSSERVVKSMKEFDYGDKSGTGVSIQGLKRLADKLGVTVDQLLKEMNP